MATGDQFDFIFHGGLPYLTSARARDENSPGAPGDEFEVSSSVTFGESPPQPSTSWQQISHEPTAQHGQQQPSIGQAAAAQVRVYAAPESSLIAELQENAEKRKERRLRKIALMRRASQKREPLSRLCLRVGSRVFTYRVTTARDAPPQDHAAYSKVSSSSDPAPLFPVGRVVSVLDAPSEAVFNCATCGAAFHSADLLARHETTHSAQKQFQCHFVSCGSSFTTQQSLRQHEQQHIEGKPFQCHLCHKMFTRPQNLAAHHRLHESGQRHFCALCGKWFRSQDALCDHQNVCTARLTGEAPASERPLRFKCRYCEKMFHLQRDRTIHERVHTGERPYTCGYCNKGFTQSQALTVHIRIHTGEKPYTCIYCGDAFKDSFASSPRVRRIFRSGLRKHEFRHHTQAAR